MLETVESVLGPIAPDQLGHTLCHEHTFINMAITLPRDGVTNVWEENLGELQRFKAAGGVSILDVSNAELSDLGAPLFWKDEGGTQLDARKNRVTGSRSIANVSATKAMAEATGLNIILGTGHYHEAYFDREWFEITSTNQIADFLIADLVDEIPGTGVRAGFLGEIAADHSHVTTAEERSFRAAARASNATGTMISTHAPTFPVGLAQLEILLDEGVPPERIVIGHADTVKHIDYSIEITRRGAFVQYDCMMVCRIGGHLNEPEITRRVDYLKRLVDQGYEDQILMSQDVCARSHMHFKGGPGYTFLTEHFYPRLVSAGVDESVVTKICVQNRVSALFGA